MQPLPYGYDMSRFPSFPLSATFSWKSARAIVGVTSIGRCKGKNLRSGLTEIMANACAESSARGRARFIWTGTSHANDNLAASIE
jgi:hypothetical protein